MAATFNDAAYNKFQKGGGSGTLIGNWSEERVIRDCTGEGRSIPQRHIPRRDLLKDWTKVPSGGARKQDDTFERIYGPKVTHNCVPFSKTIGAGEADLLGDQPVASTLQAEGRIGKLGPQVQMAKAAMTAAAEKEVQEEDEIRDQDLTARFFETTGGEAYTKPDGTLAEKAAYTRRSFKRELMHGPDADRSRALRNAGLEIQTNVHYSNVEAVTHPRMALVDPLLRNDMKVSAHGGISAFGKHSDFSKPVQEFIKGLSKDEEMENLYRGTQNLQPHNCIGGSQPRATAFGGVPSLTVLKECIHRQIGQTWGEQGYVILRQRLCDKTDHEGFVQKAVAVDVFRTDLGLDFGDVNDIALDQYLSQLITMKKSELKVSSVLSSLRPALPQAVKKRIFDAFAALGPVDGVCRLGDWLGRLSDAGLRQTLTGAFGAEDEESASNLPITEQVFLELLSDLSPLMDVDALIV